MKAEKVLKLMFGSNKDEQVVAEMNLIKDAVQNEDNLRKKRTSIFKNLFTLRTSHRYFYNFLFFIVSCYFFVQSSTCCMLADFKKIYWN